MLIVDNISIHYKTRHNIIPVIHNLPFEMKQGEALTILGPSGCGKSTLVNAMAGTISMECGRIDYIKENHRQLPYFGEQYPENIEYLVTMQSFHKQLESGDERKKELE